MYLSDTVDALAHALDTGRGRIDTLARRLQEGGLLPKSIGGSNRPAVCIGDVVSLLLAHAVGTGYGEVAKAVSDLRSYQSDAGISAGECIANMIRALIALDARNGAAAAFSTISITNGSRPAVVVRITADDEPVELTFTPDGVKWQPHKADGVFETVVVPGLTLFKLANRLRDLLPPQDEVRNFAISTVNGQPIAEWRAGVDAELERMGAAR